MKNADNQIIADAMRLAEDMSRIAMRLRQTPLTFSTLGVLLPGIDGLGGVLAEFLQKAADANRVPEESEASPGSVSGAPVGGCIGG